MKYYLAIDIGASSGRHILGHLENGIICLNEIHRFPNGTHEQNGRLCWDLDAMFSGILAGMKKCIELGKIPVSMGIDTWGVDFILLDKHGAVLGDTVPGSQELGDNIAAEFEKGFDTVVMENHGVVIGAEDLFQAFMKFETLESIANLEVYARKLGAPKTLRKSDLNLATTNDHLTMDEFTPNKHSSEECAARRDMIKLIHRSYRQKLFVSTQGTYSARLSDGSFLITPYGIDRAYMEEADLVLIRSGMKEHGKTPSRSVMLHQKIYEKHSDIRSILSANPPYAMAFAVTDSVFDPRTIPESYIMLRDIKKIPFDAIYLKQDEVADMFSSRTPVLICENNQILATGNSLLNAFDRLEVTEATAHSIIAAQDIGSLVHISDTEVEDINEAFNLN